MPSLTKIFFDERYDVIRNHFTALLGNIYLDVSLDNNERLVLKDIDSSQGQVFLQEKANKIRNLRNKNIDVTVCCPLGSEKASFVINTPFKQAIKGTTFETIWNFYFRGKASALIKETVGDLNYRSPVPDNVMVLDVSPDATAVSFHNAVEALRSKGFDLTVSKSEEKKDDFLKISINNMTPEDFVDRFYNVQKDADINNNNNGKPENKAVEMVTLLKKIITNDEFRVDNFDATQIYFNNDIKSKFFNTYAARLKMMGLEVQQVTPAPFSGYFKININNSLDEALDRLRAATSAPAQTVKMENVK